MQPDQYVALASPQARAALGIYLDAQRVEYGTYVAAEPIYAPGGVLAFRPGDAVPVSTVDAHPEWLTDGAVSTVALPAQMDSEQLAARLAQLTEQTKVLQAELDTRDASPTQDQPAHDEPLAEGD